MGLFDKCCVVEECMPTPHCFTPKAASDILLAMALVKRGSLTTTTTPPILFTKLQDTSVGTGHTVGNLIANIYQKAKECKATVLWNDGLVTITSAAPAATDLGFKKPTASVNDVAFYSQAVTVVVHDEEMSRVLQSWSYNKSNRFDLYFIDSNFKPLQVEGKDVTVKWMGRAYTNSQSGSAGETFMLYWNQNAFDTDFKAYATALPFESQDLLSGPPMFTIATPVVAGGGTMVGEVCGCTRIKVPAAGGTTIAFETIEQLVCVDWAHDFCEGTTAPSATMTWTPVSTATGGKTLTLGAFTEPVGSLITVQIAVHNACCIYGKTCIELEIV